MTLALRTVLKMTKAEADRIAFERLAEVTMLIATHEMAFARDACTRTVFMEDGSVVGDGPSDQVFRAPSSPRTTTFLERILTR